jgi:hypothetical protein
MELIKAKTCRDCGVELVLGENVTPGNLRTGVYWCKPCNAAYRKKNNHVRHARHILEKYGITAEDYNEMLESQDFSCGICQRHVSEFKQRMCVDHDHKYTLPNPDAIRGLLCWDCNSGIGKLGDNVEGLQRALDYLLKSE